MKHYLISTQIQQLLGDINYWSKHKTYSTTELAVVFHHRLVKFTPLLMAMVDMQDCLLTLLLPNTTAESSLGDVVGVVAGMTTGVEIQM